LQHTLTAVRALSPRATLQRGYALVQRAADGRLVHTIDDAPVGTALRIRLADGELAAEAGAGAPLG
jgi:exodeoxyribonuclease VII large subunit